jgi:hypothetical protein
MGSLIGKSVGIVATLLLAAGSATVAQASVPELERPVTEDELRVLAAAYERGDLGSGRCDWVHPATNGPTRIPCEVVPLPILADMARNDDEKARIRRYIRNNPVKAGLCRAAEEWRWGSAWPGWKAGGANPPED